MARRPNHLRLFQMGSSKIISRVLTDVAEQRTIGASSGGFGQATSSTDSRSKGHWYIRLGTGLLGYLRV